MTTVTGAMRSTAGRRAARRRRPRTHSVRRQQFLYGVGRYSLVIMRVVQFAGAMTIVCVAVLIFALTRREPARLG